MISFPLLSLLSLTSVVSAEYFTGDGTAYTLGQVSSGNCNFMSANSIAPTNYAALNQEQWDNLANCGRCAQVSCIDSRCTDPTASAIVQIVDRCPECKTGDLDLSPSVFKTITGSDPSRLKIQWQFVDCPGSETINICLKAGSNGYWMAVQPTNVVVGVESVRINDQPAAMVDSAYYYLVTNSTGADLSAVKVSLSSVNGETIEGIYPLAAGQCVDINAQFSPSPTTTTVATTATATASVTTTAASSTPAPTSVVS